MTDTTPPPSKSLHWASCGAGFRRCLEDPDFEVFSVAVCAPEHGGGAVGPWYVRYKSRTLHSRHTIPTNPEVLLFRSKKTAQEFVTVNYASITGFYKAVTERHEAGVGAPFSGYLPTGTYVQPARRRRAPRAQEDQSHDCESSNPSAGES